MSSPPPLHALVALAAKHIADPTTSHIHQPQYYLDTPAPPHILDAIAAICVSKPHSHVVAATLSLDSKTYQIHLTIAQNTVSLPDAQLLTHIHQVWGLLQKLGNIHTIHRRTPHLQCKAATARRELVRYVHEFAHERLMSHVREWWPKLDQISRCLGRQMRGTGVGKAKGLKGNFQTVALALRFAIPIMEKDPASLSAGAWERLISLMTIAACLAKGILKRWYECDSWGWEFGDRDHRGRSPARIALSKLTSLHRHLRVLTDFAYWPRPGGILTYTLCVTILPCPSPRHISLPTSPESWMGIITHINNHHTPADPAWPAREATELAEVYSGAQLCAPHPECALIAYLEASRRRGRTIPPAIGYVGVSKVSCSACALWIDAFNTCRGRRYKYCGSSGGWRWPWAMPGGLEVGERKMAEEVVERLWGFFSDGSRFENFERCCYSASMDLKTEQLLEREMLAWEKEMDCRGCAFGCTSFDEECRCGEVLFG